MTTIHATTTHGTTTPMTEPVTANATAMQHSPRRSTEMQILYEALAREHMRERERQARQNSLSRELASANRWRYLERCAHAAYRRHAQRAHRAAQVSAVVE